MTIEEARTIIEKTSSPHLKRDMEKFINSQQRQEGTYGKDKKGNRTEAVGDTLRPAMHA